MWRVSDDFSGTRISYGCKLWLIDWTLLAETALEKSKPTHQCREIGHNKQEHASQSPKQRQLHTPPKKYYKKIMKITIKEQL